MLNRILASPIAKTKDAITLYNGNIFSNAPSYDRSPQLSTSLFLVSCLGHLALSRLPWHRASSCHPESFQSTRRHPFVGFMVPFLKMLLNQSLVVERKFGVDSLLGTHLLGMGWGT